MVRPSRSDEVHFVPDSQEFRDFSKNWSTNFGTAYRDTVLRPPGFLPCAGTYALCFNSGLEPLPCELTEDSRFADCQYTLQTGVAFVLITAILNYTRDRGSMRRRRQRLCRSYQHGSAL